MVNLPGRTALTSDRVVGWDTETHLIRDGCKAPKMVCASFDDGTDTGLFNDVDGLDIFESYLDDMKTTLVGWHSPYDLGIASTERPRLIDKIFKGIDRGDLVCALLREKMIDNARGDLKFEWDEDLEQFKRNPGYALATRVERRFGRQRIKGEDSWQLKYSQLAHLPTDEYPEDARTYAMQDATDAREMYFAQAEDAGPDGIPNEISQIQAGWGLALMELWGVRTDAASVEALEHKLTEENHKWRRIASDAGFIRDTGSKNMLKIKEATEASLKRLNKRPMLTKGGAVSTKREQLNRCKDDKGLLALAEMGKSGKQLNTYIPVLKRGTVYPICPSYNTIIETYRTSCRAPNLQNEPRKGGIRDCFIARSGYVFVFCDYDTLEMRTLAQVCIEIFGYSRIAEACIRGEDFHLSSAAEMMGISYDEAERRFNAGDEETADNRQLCFHPDTEALTRTGWKRVGDLTYDDEVAAAIPEDGACRLEWQRPTALTSRSAQELVHLQCEGIDIRVTKNHRMLSYNLKGEPSECLPLDLHKKRGWYNTGIAPGGTWDPDEKLLRLAVATQADGSVVGHHIIFGFMKQRKVDRLRKLLEGVPYRSGISSQGAHIFTIFGNSTYRSGRQTPKGIAGDIIAMLTDKKFDERWLNLSARAREIVLHEAQYWDAHSGPRSVAYAYFSMIKSNAEILQIIATLNGRKTRLVQCSTSGMWKLTIRAPGRDRTRPGKLNTTVISYGGEVVCLSVPSTYVVVRDGGVPVITGQCKIANYGFGGGMAAKTFVAYAAGYGVTVSLEVAEQLHATYRRKWEEMVQYFNMAKRLCDGGIANQVVFPRSKLIRGRVGYTQVCNGFFQHRAAMGAKAAVYETARECYTDRTSPLWNCRPWLFAHDEIGMEVPIGDPKDMHAAAKRLEEVMVEQMSIWCPDVPIGASGFMSRRWVKGGKPVYNAQGFMVPSKAEGKKWVADLRN